MMNNTQRYAWKPQKGPQVFAMSLPPKTCIIYGGARGGGKTDLLIAMALEHVIRHPSTAQVLIMRTQFIQLDEIYNRQEKLYPQFGGKFRAGKRRWEFPQGAWIMIGHASNVQESERFQGFEFSFIGFDELQNWPNGDVFDRMQATLRSTHGIPCRWMGTCNPGNVGHLFVKSTFVDNVEPNIPTKVLDKNGDPVIGNDGLPMFKVFIPAKVQDNPALLKNDPGYISRLKLQAPHLAKMWLHGDFTAAPGAFLEGVWNENKHVIAPFDIPHWWPKFWSMDWGFSSPYAVGFYTVDPHGNIYLFAELYGKSNRLNEVDKGSGETISQICARITAMMERHPGNWRTGVADASMWNRDGRGRSIASDMRDAGITNFQHGPKGKSRVATLQLLVQALYANTFSVFPYCKEWIRTVPMLPPDEKNPEDVDTRSEDHHVDQTRYALWLYMSQQKAQLPEKKEKPVIRPRMVDNEIQFTNTGAIQKESFAEKLLRGEI